MAYYTILLKTICEGYAYNGAVPTSTDPNTVIPLARNSIFDFSFPIYDENHRVVLEDLILQHYYMREIAFETIAYWKLRLQVRMNEIMPKYNRLYASMALEYNPLQDVNYTKTHSGTHSNDDNYSEQRDKAFTGGRTNERTENSSNEFNSNTTNNNINLFQDTPQGSVANVSETDDAWLTNVTKDRGTGSESSESTGIKGVNESVDVKENTNTEVTSERNKAGQEAWTETTQGKVSPLSYGKMISDYQRLAMNVDLMIIEELDSLFMCLWD